MTGTPILMAIGESLGVFAATTMLSFALITGLFFFLKWNHKRKHPTEDDIKETNRQRREREKLKRQTTDKVNAYMKGQKPAKDSEHVPNGKRCGKYKKKN
ncbi:MAG: hypothetical protein IJM98_10755, partial [Oscillospiraceae bacterium]|nr:hypothetical protein [Oscillospiraceae bacterium]MBQ6701124.1 hypothetical protein [Oscillospiraceae bacterium]